MFYAITPRGIGKRPGCRAISNEDSKRFEGETFVIEADDLPPDLVLADDRISLRAATESELSEIARHPVYRQMLEDRGVKLTPPPETVEQKLAKIGLTASELKAALSR